VAGKKHHVRKTALPNHLHHTSKVILYRTNKCLNKISKSEISLLLESNKCEQTQKLYYKLQNPSLSWYNDYTSELNFHFELRLINIEFILALEFDYTTLAEASNLSILP